MSKWRKCDHRIEGLYEPAIATGAEELFYEHPCGYAGLWQSFSP
jgi:hypothetical protein